MPGTVMATVLDTQFSMKWRTQYATEALNRKGQVSPRGICRGFIPVPTGVAYQISLNVDPMTGDSVMNAVSKTGDYSITYRETANYLLTFDHPVSSGKRYYVGLLPTYVIGSTTTLEWKKFTQAEFNAGDLDDAVAAFAVDIPVAHDPIPAEDIYTEDGDFARDDQSRWISSQGDRRQEVVAGFECNGPSDGYVVTTPSVGTLSFDDSDKKFGVSSLKFLNAGGVDDTFMLWGGSTSFFVVPGEKLTYQFWYKMLAGTVVNVANNYLKFWWYTSAGVAISSDEIAITTVEVAWTLVRSQVVVPATAMYCKLTLTETFNTGAMWIDKVQVLAERLPSSDVGFLEERARDTQKIVSARYVEIGEPWTPYADLYRLDMSGSRMQIRRSSGGNLDIGYSGETVNLKVYGNFESTNTGTFTDLFTSDTVESGLEAKVVSNTANPVVQGVRGRAATYIVQDEDILNEFSGGGYYTGVLINRKMGSFLIKAAKAWSAGDTPTKLEFWTTPDSSVTPALRGTVDLDGKWYLENDLQVEGDSTRKILGSTYSDTLSSEILGVRVRGSMGVPAAVQASDILATFGGRGAYNATPDFMNSGLIVSRAAGNWSAGHYPSQLEFWTTVTAGASALRLTIDKDGIATFAKDVICSDDLDVVDNVTIGGDAVVTGEIKTEGTLFDQFVTSRQAGAVNDPIFRGVKSRGTIAAPAAVETGDVVASFLGGGFVDGATDVVSARIVMSATGNWGPATAPTSIGFFVTPVGAIVPALAYTIDSDGTNTWEEDGTFNKDLRVTDDFEVDGNTGLGTASASASYVLHARSSVNSIIIGHFQSDSLAYTGDVVKTTAAESESDAWNHIHCKSHTGTTSFKVRGDGVPVIPIVHVLDLPPVEAGGIICVDDYGDGSAFRLLFSADGHWKIAGDGTNVV